MPKARALVTLAAVMSGCVAPTKAWKGEVEWPDEQSAQLVASPMEAGAALAAAGAIREMVRTNPHPHLFSGCSSPEQGLDVSVYTGPTPGLYYVVLDERFDRCGGPRGRVLDWWYVYAVTPQGEVVAEAPPPAGEAPVAPHAPASPEGPQPPAEPTPPEPPASPSPENNAPVRPPEPTPPTPAGPEAESSTSVNPETAAPAQ